LNWTAPGESSAPFFCVPHPAKLEFPAIREFNGELKKSIRARRLLKAYATGLSRIPALLLVDVIRE
jgi:hypothetical protein